MHPKNIDKVIIERDAVHIVGLDGTTETLEDALLSGFFFDYTEYDLDWYQEQRRTTQYVIDRLLSYSLLTRQGFQHVEWLRGEFGYSRVLPSPEETFSRGALASALRTEITQSARVIVEKHVMHERSVLQKFNASVEDARTHDSALAVKATLEALPDEYATQVKNLVSPSEGSFLWVMHIRTTPNCPAFYTMHLYRKQKTLFTPEHVDVKATPLTDSVLATTLSRLTRTPIYTVYSQGTGAPLSAAELLSLRYRDSQGEPFVHLRNVWINDDPESPAHWAVMSAAHKNLITATPPFSRITKVNDLRSCTSDTQPTADVQKRLFYDDHPAGYYSLVSFSVEGPDPHVNVFAQGGPQGTLMAPVTLFTSRYTIHGFVKKHVEYLGTVLQDLDDAGLLEGCTHVTEALMMRLP